MALRIVKSGNIESVSQIDHNQAFNRELSNQHPIDAITNLQSILDDLTTAKIRVVNSIEDMNAISNTFNGLIVLVLNDSSGDIIYRYKASTQEYVPISSSGTSSTDAEGTTVIQYESCAYRTGEYRVLRETTTGDINKTVEYEYDSKDRITTETTTKDGKTITRTMTYADQSVDEDLITQIVTTIV